MDLELYKKLPEDVQHHIGVGSHGSSGLDRVARVYLGVHFLAQYTDAVYIADGDALKKLRLNIKTKACWATGKNGEPKGLFWVYPDLNPANPYRVCTASQSWAMEGVGRVGGRVILKLTRPICRSSRSGSLTEPI
jgi:hypothetical protein